MLLYFQKIIMSQSNLINLLQIFNSGQGNFISLLCNNVIESTMVRSFLLPYVWVDLYINLYDSMFHMTCRINPEVFVLFWPLNFYSVIVYLSYKYHIGAFFILLGHAHSLPIPITKSQHFSLPFCTNPNGVA